MANGKLALVLVMLLAIGLIVLPETVSLFEGQHIWYPKQDMNDKCNKCHADVADELAQSAVHTNFKCTVCHQVNLQSEGAHAAATLACIDCHQSVSNEFQNDVHKPFYDEAEKSTLMTGPNEACVACHTHTQTNITFTHKQVLEFTAEPNGGGSWTLSQFQAK